MSDRSEKILTEGMKLLMPIFKDRVQDIFFSRNNVFADEIKLFINLVDQAIQKAIEYQKIGEFDDASVLCIVPLHIGEITETYEYGIFVYDQLMCCNSSEAESYAILNFIFEKISQDIKYAIDRLKRDFPRIQFYETILLRKWYVANYRQIAFQVLRVIAQKCQETKSYSELRKNPTFQIMYGEFMDVMVPIESEKK